MSPPERAGHEASAPRHSSLLGDLRLGTGLALRGGRESLLRTLFTAVGVGAATATLLLAASLPTILEHADERSAARMDYEVAEHPPPEAGDDTLIFRIADTDYRSAPIFGRIIHAEGPDAPLPPGVDTLPTHDEIVVSPALAALLDDPEHEVLQRRYDHTVIGQIDPEGLDGPHELAFYLGDERLTLNTAGNRITHYGGTPEGGVDDPVLLLLGVVGTVVMLTPVVVFLGAAVRFGGEQRNRRLAALRLMGADRRATRQVAAGEALPGIALGLSLGAGLYFAGRPIVETVPLSSGVYGADVMPHPVLGPLVFVAVPLLALWVVFTSMRGVVIEPLGTVRRSERRNPRLWWRLILCVLGVALIIGALRTHQGGGLWVVLVAIGLLTTLVGMTAVLPWLIDRLFGRASGGFLSLQLAFRRLGSADGGPARAIGGIVVTVAGAIALQSLFAGAEAKTTVEHADTVEEVYEQQEFGAAGYNLQAELRLGSPDDDAVRALGEVAGVEAVVAFTDIHAPGFTAEDTMLSVRVADCATLIRMADLPSCSPGDVFTGMPDLAQGAALMFGGSEDAPPVPWEMPTPIPFEGSLVEHPSWASMAPSAEDVVLATPEAGAPIEEAEAGGRIWLRVDPSAPGIQEELRATVAGLDPTYRMLFPMNIEYSSALLGIRNILIGGALASLAMITAGMVVGAVEQIRERKRVHAVLTAFGTRRRTLVASVLWQTALPMLLGISLATATGLGLGALLLDLVHLPVTFDPVDVLIIAGGGIGMVLLTTLATLPALMRSMRPEGLRWE